eukprot:gene20124-30929_t
MRLSGHLVLVGLAVAVTRGQAAGHCCYLCDVAPGPGACYGCFPAQSYCSQYQENCQNDCSSTWLAAMPPIVAPPQQTQPSSSPPPVIWTAKQNSGEIVPGKPTVSGGHVYTTPGGLLPILPRRNVSWVQKVALSDGTRVWKQPIPPRSMDGNETLFHTSFAPVIADDTIYVQIISYGTLPRIVALTTDNGSRLWDSESSHNAFPLPLAAGDQRVYSVNVTGYVESRAACDGAGNWTFDAGFVSAMNPPVLVNGVVYKSGTNSGQHAYVFAIDAVTGTEIWSAPFTALPWQTGVAVINDLTLVTTTVFRSAGTMYLPIPSLPYGPPEGPIVAFEGGNRKWSFELAASTSFPASHVTKTGEELFIVTACETPPLPGAPPLWWIGCSLWAFGLNDVPEDLFRSVRWRFVANSSYALSPPQVSGGVVFVGGAAFSNGTWPYCVWPPWEPYPNCTFSTDTPQLPKFTDPFIIALDANDGSFLWTINVTDTAGDFSWDDILDTLEEYSNILSGETSVADWTDAELAGFVAKAKKCAFAKAFIVTSVSGGAPAGVLFSEHQSDYSMLPWNQFTTDAEGRRLIYTDDAGLVGLDISGRVPAAGSSSWVVPIVIATGGLLLVIACCRLLSRGCLSRSSPESGVESSQSRVGKFLLPQNGGPSITCSAEEQHGYVVLKALGRGGFGSVFLVRRQFDSHLYSLKRIDCRTAKELKIAKREVSILSNLPEHSGLMCIIESFTESSSVFMVLPYYEQ